MIDFLAGVPGKLKTLTDRLTATWATKLDTLHDSRLTSARAGYLDKLNISGNVVGETALSTLQTTILADPMQAPPTSMSAPNTISSNTYSIPTNVSGLTYVNSTATTWTTLLDVSGKGVIDFLGMELSIRSFTGHLRLTIDGNIVSTTSIDGNTVHLACCTIIGSIYKIPADTHYMPGIAFGAPVPFRSSLKVEAYGTIGYSKSVFWHYRVSA